MNIWLIFLAGLLSHLPAAAQPDEPATLDRYNVVWTSPSRDASGSMPIGNGETGLNVWVEEGGDLVFYISRTDAWSETDRLLKLARVRISLSPNPFAKGLPFRQELVLREGRVEITAGEPASQAALRLYVNAAGPDVHIDGEFKTPTTVTSTLECWRTERKTFENDDELRSSWTMHSAPAAVRKDLVWESPDTIISDDNAVVWHHRNEHSVVPFTLKHQGLETIASTFPDPLIRRTFGARMSGPGFTLARQPGVLRTTSPISSIALRITTHSAQTPTASAWRDDLRRLDAAAPADARKQTAAWWREFWDRSYILVRGDPAPAAPASDPPPRNTHPLRIGADSNSQNVFRGYMPHAAIFDHALTAEEILRRADDPAAPAPWWQWEPADGRRAVPPRPSHKLTLKPIGEAREGTPMPDGPALVFEGGHFEAPAAEIPEFPGGFTLDAIIAPSELSPARIFDKMTAGGDDGFIFDTHPGDALRLIVGNQTLSATGVLKRGQWHRVAATFDPASGRLALYLDRKLIKESSATFHDPAPPSRVTQAYILQRYMAACGGRSVSGDAAFPIKFNGSIFTVEPAFTESQTHNPDWRKWGGDFWWQNTRLPYYPMLAAGDFDLMDPLFRFYESAAPGARARARLYHGAEGLYFPETMTTFGTYSNGDYGWNRENAKPSDIHCPWWQWAWQQSLELAQLMLDHAAYTGDRPFLTTRAIPMANDALRYYDSRFKRDEKGKLLISPTQAVETYWNGVVNDAPSIGGLHAVCDALLSLPSAVTTPDDRAFWQRMKDATPALPTWTVSGKPAAAPAESFTNKRSNCETAELYPLFPFRQYGPGKPGLDLAINAYRARVDKSHVGWTQDDMFAAMLGLTDEAKSNLLAKVGNSHRNFRFPAMWGPNFDWLPDQDHGSNILSTLQLMLLQCDGEEIRLLPAWPREWGVSFKLHAPNQTTVQVEYRDGRIQRLVVTPEYRRANVVMPPAQ
ncbi:hypothetical protein PHYC_02145 [Phycisphaerales bacterium]|nr:hypothetical protein PHYC_02145 [Phycisphaerales bacterium]